MIKFSGERDGKPVIGLGLSRGNCERLLVGKPIEIDVGEMLPSVQLCVFLFAGETEEQMAEEIRKAGLLVDVPVHPVAGLADPLMPPPLIPVVPKDPLAKDVFIWETDGGKPR